MGIWKIRELLAEAQGNIDDALMILRSIEEQLRGISQDDVEEQDAETEEQCEPS